MNGTNGKYRTLIFLFVYTVNTFVVFFFFFFESNTLELYNTPFCK